MHYNGYEYGTYDALSLQHNPTLARLIVEPMRDLDQLLKAIRSCEMLRQVVLRTPAVRNQLQKQLEQRCAALALCRFKRVYPTPDNPHARTIVLSRARLDQRCRWQSLTVLPVRQATTVLEVLLQRQIDDGGVDNSSSSRVSVRIYTVKRPTSIDERGLVKTNALFDACEWQCGVESCIAVDLPLDANQDFVVMHISAEQPFDAFATLQW